MNIISTQNFVAGIFAQWTDAQQYLTLKPPEINGFVHTSTDLVYPFYLLEIGDGTNPFAMMIDTGFIAFQTEAEARAKGVGVGIILYTITEDYQPEQPWTDSMGNLPHDHLVDDD